MIRRNNCDNKNGKENKDKYNFRGKSTISIHWFGLDHEWLEEKCRTREPDLYKKFIKNILGVMRQKHIHYL